jgi:hypothetical protein
VARRCDKQIEFDERAAAWISVAGEKEVGPKDGDFPESIPFHLSGGSMWSAERMSEAAWSP